ncbi:MAG: substrate-binding domain-containing protein [Opitutaceae bacterium]|nr:substrate-binding domain-containing protein [Opitutaceae bacterium]
MPRVTSKTIGLFARADLSFKRELLRGVAAEAQARGNWELLLLAPVNRRVGFNVPPIMDGLIMWPDDPAEMEPLLAAEVPTVTLGHLKPMREVARVIFDNVKVGRMIAEGFVERGFRHFAAYFQRTMYSYSQDRLAGFREGVAAAGAAEPALFDGDVMSHEPVKWQEGLDALGVWLRGLPKPAGICCDTDQAGADLLRACQHLGVRVPDEVAVIGVGDDDLLCALAHPPLSSVSLRGREVGRMAVAMLDERMRWPRRIVRTQVMEQFTLVERASSELLAVEDGAVAAALRCIRERATQGIGVDDVVNATALSRRMLEVRFKAATGRTLHEEIVRVRMARAQVLLETTELAVAEVAERAGFSEPQRLCEAFARKLGVTPLEWRRRAR